MEKFRSVLVHSVEFRNVLRTKCRFQECATYIVQSSEVRYVHSAEFCLLPQLLTSASPIHISPLFGSDLYIKPPPPLLLKSSIIFHIYYFCCCIKLKHPSGSSTSLHTVGGSTSLTCRKIIQCGCRHLHCTLGTCNSLVPILHSLRASQKIRSVRAIGRQAVTCKHRSRISVFTNDSGEQGAEGLSQR